MYKVWLCIYKNIYFYIYIFIYFYIYIYLYIYLYISRFLGPDPLTTVIINIHVSIPPTVWSLGSIKC